MLLTVVNDFPLNLAHLRTVKNKRFILLRRILEADKSNGQIVRAKMVVMSRQVPLLYFVICVNTIFVSYVHLGLAPIGITMTGPAVIVAICGYRSLLWARRIGRPITDEAAASHLDTKAIIAAAVATSMLTWSLAMMSYGSYYTRDYAITFLLVTAICSLFCFVQLQSALLLQLVILAFPLSALLLFSDAPLAVPMGLNLLLICGGILFASRLEARDFEDIVNTKTFALALSDRNAELANIDILTGLPNRRQLQLHIIATQADGERIALGFLDLDGFKAINDNYGHKVGDQLIQAWAREITTMVASHCFIARLGGDEFALVMSGYQAARRIEDISRLILERMRRSFRIDDRVLTVGATIGLAAEKHGRIDAAELMRRADLAMYAAKCAGKMRFEWFHEGIDRSRAAAHRIARDLRHALAEDRFNLVYQPIVDAADGRIRSVEALLRWDRMGLPEIGPAVFIPVAEETGLIDQLGMWVLRRACMDALAWPEIKLVVNFSAAQLRNPELVQNIVAVFDACQFPPQRLEIDVTEPYVLRDRTAAQQVVQRLCDLGIDVALDDFGTGFASVGLLAEMPFAKLKIDRSLVEKVGTEQSARAIIQAGVTVARSLEMSVVAEGIETEDQATLMRFLGCTQLQGWFFAKPCDAAGIQIQLDENEALRAGYDVASPGQTLA